MKVGLYSIRDVRTGFLNITTEMNDQSAIRNFDHASRDERSLFYSHGADYSLYKLGSFDTDTGEIVLEKPTILKNGGNK